MISYSSNSLFQRYYLTCFIIAPHRLIVPPCFHMLQSTLYGQFPRRSDNTFNFTAFKFLNDDSPTAYSWNIRIRLTVLRVLRIEPCP